MVTRMDALFLIDRDARRRELTVEERQAHRRQYAEEWLQEIRETCLELAQQALAEKRTRPSRGLHLKYVDQAAAVFRLRRSGAVQ